MKHMIMSVLMVFSTAVTLAKDAKRVPAASELMIDQSEIGPAAISSFNNFASANGKFSGHIVEVFRGSAWGVSELIACAYSSEDEENVDGQDVIPTHCYNLGTYIGGPRDIRIESSGGHYILRFNGSVVNSDSSGVNSISTKIAFKLNATKAIASVTKSIRKNKK